MSLLNTNRALIGYPQVEVILKEQSHLYCHKCPLSPHNTTSLIYGYVALNTGVMLTHLALHLKAGDTVPAGLTELLLKEDYDNFPEGGSGGGYFTAPRAAMDIAHSFGATH